MGHDGAVSSVFAVEFTVSDPARVSSVLSRHQNSLLDLGARYAFVYESVVEPGRVFVAIGVTSQEPLLSLLRSPRLFEWFDAVGLDDLPAVFAGKTVERFDIGEPPTPGNEVVVAAVTRVDRVDDFMTRVRESLDEFAGAGISRTLVYHAFDTPGEMLFLQQLASERTALRWVERSDIAEEWLATAGVGGYPPVFVGRFVYAMRLADPSGWDTH